MFKVREIENLFSPFAEKEKVEVVDVCYTKENGDWILKIFIDKENGVNMDDCERLSKIFSKILDENDILDNSYILEVSSPGLNRILKKESHFKKFVRSNARIQTFNPINNQKNFLGEILEVLNGSIKLNDVTNGQVEIRINNIKKANVEELL
ncbi:MAG: ribosome maturation factor RimP [Elusimicrobiota bacterium]|jgi:ribosome maturation factor RimP|nr:ribosome maturation factor RimP [Elusimicrobiota bacterium]